MEIEAMSDEKKQELEILKMMFSSPTSTINRMFILPMNNGMRVSLSEEVPGTTIIFSRFAFTLDIGGAKDFINLLQQTVTKLSAMNDKTNQTVQ